MQIINVKRILLFIFLNLLIPVHSATIQNKQAELSHVKSQIKSLEATLSATTQKRTNLQLQLKNAELSLATLSEQINQLTQALSKQKIILNELNKNQQHIENRLTIQNNLLSHQLQAAYKLGSTNQLKMILNQEEMNSAPRHLIYYKALNNARAKLIEDIQSNLVLLQKTIRKSQHHQQSLLNLIAEKKRQEAHQHHILKIRQALISALSAQNQNKQQQIQILLANQKALEETITRLKQREISITGKSFDHVRGQLAWPIRGRFIAAFGTLVDGTLRSNGIIIQAPLGTPVHAIYSGKVIFADWLRGFGLLIIINHGHQYMSLYARNQAIYAKPGQIIQTGDVIATTGNSGGYKNAGLYFELRQNGTPINPGIWCR